ncbi:DUF3667 domain-containing protein [Pseudoxanthomonas sp. PXM02]|uniref:DUF3667 domain-containing protein n=1 Tax=Pseudoxanthomonas sp. PXM02 TaxID=2769294 RepID=UPI001782703B|nr:DUF3667 domain-containing protein [Pseudoxanthomonas sp. PXM02]MBD9480237.1 DUF3667 domain-containing protein [Pseudoxanthomonas sp. PXM02]
MTPSHDADAVHASACENCRTPLQGGFCHVCGQNAHSPLKSVGHAVEEVFESFWHLDGRIFRTLRTLLSPGKLANAYLAGHRAPFVAPLRLFVILSVLTFFVAKLTLHIGEVTLPEPPPTADGTTNLVAAPDQSGIDFSKQTTVEGVIKQRDETLKGLVSARAGVPSGLGFVRERIEDNIYATQRLARERITQLQPDHPALKQPDRYPQGQPLPALPESAAITIGGKPFDAETNPVRVSWLPEFANRWINKKLARGEENIPRLAKDPEHFFTLLIGSVPSALFVLVPVFALLLRLAYIETGRVYLEHLVVALYSHAYLCLCILVFCLVQALGNLIPPGNFWLKIPQWTAQLAVLGWMPVYLLWMQQRVYRQHFIVTLLKFSVLGTLYFFMLMTAIVFLVLTTWVNA